MFQLGDPRLFLINNTIYLALETLGAGATSTVFKAEMLIPYGYELVWSTAHVADPYKSAQPAVEEEDGVRVVQVSKKEGFVPAPIFIFVPSPRIFPCIPRRISDVSRAYLMSQCLM